jgi:hypothetical protein
VWPFVKSDPIDLWTYTDDYEFDDQYLSFTVAHSETMMVDFGLVISGNRYLYIEPVTTKLGQYPLRVRVQDPTGLASTGVFTVQLNAVAFLPSVLRNHYTAPWLKPIQRVDAFYPDDGHYRLEWVYPLGGSYQTEFSYNDPTFANGQTYNVYSGEYETGFFTWPGMHYWRVRVLDYVDGQWVPGTPWSNVQSTSVGQYAYLHVDNESYAFDMTVRIMGNGLDESIHLESRSGTYWRSVPVGTYTFQITNQLCAPDTRMETVTLQNAGVSGAWYMIDTCESISGPSTQP